MTEGKGQLLLVGEIVGCFGTKGWVKVVSWCQPRRNIFQYQPWFLLSKQRNGDLESSNLTVTVVDSGSHRGGKGLIARLEQVESMDDSNALIGLQIYIQRQNLKRTDNEYYWHDLIGLEVFNANDEWLGEVKALIETGAHDVLDIQQKNTDRMDLSKHQELKDYLIPYVWDRFILSVCLHQRRIIVDWDISWHSQ